MSNILNFIKSLFAKATNLEEIERINESVNRRILYVSDESKDHWQTPEQTEGLGFGDCEDIAFLKAHLIEKLVKDASVIIVKNYADKTFCHAVVRATLNNGEVVYLDNIVQFVMTPFQFYDVYYEVKKVTLADAPK